MAGADWQALSLQLALFTQRALPLNTDIFSLFAGAAPETQEDRPRQGTRTQVGPLDDAQLRIIITPIRVDIALLPAPLDGSVLGGIQFTTGELKAQLGRFAKLSLDWLPRWDVPTTRLSLVVRAAAFTKTTEETYQLLKENLSSVHVRPGEMSDLIFRVNWKAKTNSISDGYYNRLTTWNSQSVAVSGTAAAGPEVMLDRKEFAQVEMDLNTPGDRTTPLPPDRFTTIFKDLHQLALEIADTGEHP